MRKSTAHACNLDFFLAHDKSKYIHVESAAMLHATLYIGECQVMSIARVRAGGGSSPALESSSTCLST